MSTSSCLSVVVVSGITGGNSPSLLLPLGSDVYTAEVVSFEELELLPAVSIIDETSSISSCVVVSFLASLSLVLAVSTISFNESISDCDFSAVLLVALISIFFSVLTGSIF